MEREFVAPGPGTWSLDTTHNSGAMTPYSGSCFNGLARGFKEGGEKYGLLMSHLKNEFLHGFMFSQQVGVVGKPGSGPPPKFLMQLMFKIHPALRKRVNAAHHSIENRLWLKDLEEWDEMKKDSIKRNTRLQSVDFSTLDREGMIAHLEECYENAQEMVYRHHKFSVGSILPIGRLLDVATRNSGLSAAEVAPLLKGSTQVSTGIAAEELSVIVSSITDAGISSAELEALKPDAALEKLKANSAIAESINDYLTIAGYMLIGGYCISEATLRESPNIIIARIIDAMSPHAGAEFDAELEQRIRGKIPDTDHAEFDLTLADARKVNRMRDERGIYNDIWGAGVSRTAILEAGRRLQEEGVLTEAALLLEATHQEMIDLLNSGTSVDDATLRERQIWRNTKSIDEVPEILGMEPQEPPPMEWLPLKIRPTMQAFAAVMGNVFDEPREVSQDIISGSPVSPGVYEGIAKVILSTKDFDRLEKGDVLITKNTSAGFNVVLPIIGALVTDRGGILSHAAIVSREYGIPGVVSTKTATQLIKEGSRVRVDGDSGEVTVLG